MYESNRNGAYRMDSAVRKYVLVMNQPPPTQQSLHESNQQMNTTSSSAIEESWEKGEEKQVKDQPVIGRGLRFETVHPRSASEWSIGNQFDQRAWRSSTLDPRERGPNADGLLSRAKRADEK